MVPVLGPPCTTQKLQDENKDWSGYILRERPIPKVLRKCNVALCDLYLSPRVSQPAVGARSHLQSAMALSPTATTGSDNSWGTNCIAWFWRFGRRYEK